jgi:hypothetical protein
VRLTALSYAEDGGLARLLEATGGRANLISIVCNEILKAVDLSTRLIERERVEQALFSDAVIDSLRVWEHIDHASAEERRLARLLVYLTVAQGEFAEAEVLAELRGLGMDAPPASLNRVLQSLSLAYVLQRRSAQGRESYVYPVPLFREWLLSRQPDKLLAEELAATR